MALIIPSAPDQSIEALRASAPAIARSAVVARVAPKLTAALTSSAASHLSPTLSYPVYTLGLADLASATTEGLARAKLSLWRHTLTTDGEVVTVDISIGADGAQTLSAVNAHPSAAAVESAINELNQAPEAASGSYELSVLQVPALSVRALWLHDPSGRSSDLVIPVAPVRSELTAGQRYEVAEFANALRQPAARILADDDPRKGSG